MFMNQISGVIVSLNEEKNIEACIKSLQKICDEIIVVDSYSQDKTVTVAEKSGAKVYRQSYLGDGPQKNFAANLSKNKWVLSLDADERLSEEAIAAINKLDLNNTDFEAYAFRRKNFYRKKWIQVCGWYPDYCIRLFSKEKTCFSELKLHDRILTYSFRRIQADILHYPYENIEQLFFSRKYSIGMAKIMHEEGKRINSFSPFLHGTGAFLARYFLQRGFMGGVDGFTIALSSSVNTYIKYAKLLELNQE